MFCYSVYHIECFFSLVKHLKGKKIDCQLCFHLVGRDVDMMLLPHSHQLSKRWHDYMNDGALLLEFFKYIDWSQIERMNLCEKGVNTLEKDMAKCRHLYHLTRKPKMLRRPSSLPTLVLFSIQQQLTIVFQRGA